MAGQTFEDRVAVLEREFAELRSRSSGRVKDWRRTIGAFTDNPDMKDVFAEAMKLRESDRRKVRGRQPKRPATDHLSVLALEKLR